MSEEQDRDDRGPLQTVSAEPRPTIPDDLVAMLDLLATTIVEALGFGVAAINIARPDGTLEVVSVAGDELARKALLGSSNSAALWDQILAVSEPRGRLRFVDHRSEQFDPDLLSWVPDTASSDAEDAWHPDDALFAPLTAADGSLLGILSVDLPRDGRQPGEATCSALEAFAVSTALAIEHATLRSRAELSERSFKWLATHDPLTGAGNRSILFERLEHSATTRLEHRSLLALVFLDLDDFKNVNDFYSHDVGDHILTEVAGRMRSVIREHDTVVRWGGDEFLVLLSELDNEAAGLAAVQRILTAVAAPIRHLGHELGVTASVGVAFRHAADEVDADELVRRADAAMYRVKHTGRNAFAVFDTVGEPAL